MRILFGTLFLIMAIFPKPGELMFRKFGAVPKGQPSNPEAGPSNTKAGPSKAKAGISNARPFVLYSHRYEMNSVKPRFSRLYPGEHKVGLDEHGKHIIGYAEPGENGYILLPFVEHGPYRALGEQRLKMIINVKDARKYETLQPAEKLNALFFKPVEHLADALVMEHPNPNPKIID